DRRPRDLVDATLHPTSAGDGARHHPHTPVRDRTRPAARGTTDHHEDADLDAPVRPHAIATGPERRRSAAAPALTAALSRLALGAAPCTSLSRRRPRSRRRIARS